MAQGLVQKMMADTDADEPQSGPRPAQKPEPVAHAKLVLPRPAAIPRLHDDDDPLDPMSMGELRQSGDTKIIEVAKVVSASTAPAATSVSSPPVAQVTIGTQVDAYRSAPARNPDARLVLYVCAAVSIGVAALFVLFLAA